MIEKKKILICPLDWGLGHATRCIPIIRELLTRGCEVKVASSGDALALLKSEFPALSFYEITGYRPFYGSSKWFALSLALQIPKFSRAIRREHEEIGKIVQQEAIEVIISDNRYGCWSAEVPAILITHQINIKAPRLLSRMVNSVNRRWIGKFTSCWVPDREGANSLAGDMSANPGIDINYIGPLSRFSRREPLNTKYEVLAIISGPEPQRKIFETLVRHELKKSGKKALMVRGLPQLNERTNDGMLEEVAHLTADKLNQVILESEMIISRPGYSTIMDLAALGRKAVFVPTPGQPEQEYLGKELMARKIAFCVSQGKFTLDHALSESIHYTGFENHSGDHLLQTALDKLLR